MKTTDIRVTPKMDRNKTFDNAYPRKPVSKKRVFDALREYDANCDDAGATFIRILLDIDKKQFIIMDDGHGFNDRQRHGFFWLNVSEKAQSKTAKAYTGQHGTGRTKAIVFLEKITAITVAQDAKGSVLTASLTRDLLRDIWNETAQEQTWKQTTLPSWWHLPKGATGSAIVLEMSDENWARLKKEANPEIIIRELSNMLHPSSAAKVTVNDRPLIKRALLRPALERTFTEREIGDAIGETAAKALGDITVELFMPAEKRDRSECVKLGSKSAAVCDIAQFVEGLGDPKLISRIPEILLRGQLIGVIFATGLNKFVNDDRESLDAKLYEETHVFLLRFLSDVLGPVVKEAYAREEKDSERKRDKKTLTGFCQEFSKAFRPGGKFILKDDEDADLELKDESPDGDDLKEPKTALQVNRRRVVMMVGDTLELEVLNDAGLDADDLVWDGSEIGKVGVLSLERGPLTVFTAKGLGNCFVYLRNRKKPKEEYVHISISIIAERLQCVSPRSVSIPQGSRQRFRVRNHKDTCGTGRWSLNSSRGLRIINVEGLETHVQVMDSCPIGTYVITWEGKGESCEAEFEVVTGSDPAVIAMGDHIYVLHPAEEEQAEPVILSQNKYFSQKPGGKKAGEAVVKLNHPDFVNAQKLAGGDSTEVIYLLLLDSIVWLHLQLELKAEVIDDMEDAAKVHQEMRTKFLMDRAAPSTRKK